VKNFCPLLGLIVIALLAGCGPKPEDTANKLQADIRAYRASPSVEARSKAEDTLAKLDREIAALAGEASKKQGDARTSAELELQDIRRRRAELVVDFQTAKFGEAVDDAKSAVQNFGESVGAGIREVGKAFTGTNTNR